MSNSSFKDKVEKYSALQSDRIEVHDDYIVFRNEIGQLHRENGPAVEYSDGTKSWYINGKRHRVNNPAIERPNGYKCWYINGKRHREDGPALEFHTGSKRWFLNNIEYSEEDFNKKISKLK